MSDAVLRCPGCGAPATADAASCAYCGSSLATKACGSCFAPMFLGSRFCASCGAEARRESIGERGDLHCPHCRVSLQALRFGATEAAECAACGGLWLEPDVMKRLVEAKEDAALVVAALALRVPTGSITAGPVHYLPCPDCAKLMNRVNFGYASGIILDVCKWHGLWLDRGELQGVLAFVEHGGLTVARNRDAAQEQIVVPGRRPSIVTFERERAQMSVPEAEPSLGERILVDAGGRTLATILLYVIGGFFTNIH